jgi:FAD/FMN-containing dehydrogenase/Fe-S oxidoreductase
MKVIFDKAFHDKFDGEIESSLLHRSVYATDASVYRELPTAVCYPKHTKDLQNLVEYASFNDIKLIPRGGGTSLAGQCVGTGVVVDLSRYFNKILEFNKEEKWVKVQVGMVRDELNYQLKSSGLFFGPNTSTANRCTLGGMFGNNSSGTSSIRYGTTRTKTLEAELVLNNGLLHTFTRDENKSTNEEINRILSETLSINQDKTLEDALLSYFPKKDIHRRNSGYALDKLFQEDSEKNFIDILSGSEGTLGICTELKLQLDEIPPEHVSLVCPHFDDVIECLEAVQPSMEHPLYACEMMDDIILSCTASNPMYAKKRFFVNGKPKALLILELRSSDPQILKNQVEALKNSLQKNTKTNHISIVNGAESKDVWELRKAGLGLLANLGGNKKAVACIEDTAVSIEDLPAYINDFTKIMKNFGQEAVYYAHAGAGEIHLRPLLDLSSKKGKQEFRAISTQVAELVKKYKGSLSGEHGDGRVRAEFLKPVYGDVIYDGFIKLKDIWDPKNIFNPGKIVFAPAMDEQIRDQIPMNIKISSPSLKTEIDLNRIADKCNGSGDCRKGIHALGQMCPSYKASGKETDTTRARANAFREFHQIHDDQNTKLKSKDLRNILQHCVSCKACATECPSNVDMGLLKMAFEEYDSKNKSFDIRRYFFGNIYLFNRLGILSEKVTNTFVQSKAGKSSLQNILGLHSNRSLPKLIKFNFNNWKKRVEKENQLSGKKEVGLLIDEFNRFNKPDLFPKAAKVLQAMGFKVNVIDIKQTGRALFSKGYIAKGKTVAVENMKTLSHYINRDIPVIGLEPSAISCFWDEYKKLSGLNTEQTNQLAKLSLTFSSFIAQSFNRDEFSRNIFDTKERKILLHTHCHEKALGSPEDTKLALSIPSGHNVQHIKSACCGMAGSYGYQKENFAMSQKMASLALIPAIEEKPDSWIITAQGISCSHQIEDLSKKKALHPVEIFYEALKD